MIGILPNQLKSFSYVLFCLSLFILVSCQTNSENILSVKSVPTSVSTRETSPTDSPTAIPTIDLKNLKQACTQSKYPKIPGTKWTYKVYSEFTQNNVTTIKNYTITTTISDKMEIIATCDGDCQTFDREFAPAEYLNCDLPLYGYGEPSKGITCTTENNTIHCAGKFKNGITDICTTDVTEIDEAPTGLIKTDSVVECPSFKTLSKMELVQFEPEQK